MANKKIILSFSVLFITVFVIAGTKIYSAWGQASDTNNSSNSGTVNTPEVDQLSSDIQSKKNAIDALKVKQDEYKRALEDKQSQKADLQNQIAIFDNRIAAMELSIEDVKLNIEKTNLEIKRLDLQVLQKEYEIDLQKRQVATALSLLYQEKDKSDLEVILLNDNFSDYIDQVQHLKDLNNGIADKLSMIKNLKKTLEDDRSEMAIKRLNLQSMADDLASKLGDLTDEKDGKQYVLSETQQSESEYQRLLAKAQQEQQAASADISSLESSLRAKLTKNEQFQEITANSQGFVWPVAKNTITAYFHDPSYPFRKVFEHPAIDIKAAQGSTIYAVAAGYVARVKRGSDGSYGYIMIVHAGGLSTVYGHASQINVTEEQYVTQGQVIGLSGGRPGTPGAGPFTTGAHLHFETRLNGIPVDPLGYLN